MRRRSERKKSVEVCSPVTPASRRSRRRKSPSLSESEKLVEPSDDKTKSTITEEEKTVVEEKTTTSRRGTRRRTPVKERTISPVKKSATQVNEAKCASEKIDVIPEEENGSTTNTEQCEGIQNDTATTNPEDSSNEERVDAKEINNAVEVKDQEAEKESEEVSPVEEEEDKEIDKTSKASVESIVEEDSEMTEVAEERQADEKPEIVVELPIAEESVDNEDNAVSTAAPDEDVEAQDEEVEAQEPQQQPEEEEQTKSTVVTNTPDEDATETVPHSEENSANHETNLNDSCTENARTRKRKWITKKTTDNKSPILAISTDSLKNLIADVQPVPLSDVKLDSSPEVEEVPSELEDGEEASSPERPSDREDERIREKTEEKERERRISSDAATQEKPKRQQKQNDVGSVQQQQQQNHHAKSEPVRNSPSPARNVSSSILYITNLVRPFTVLQLKGLLARTGKIVEDGFWIDRIKSKCFVKYETEDEAVETRHALHGVRWPVSNPKCLNVEFGLEADMNKAIESTKEETTKTPQENYRENVIVGSGWTKERHDEDSKAKSARHVREWDVGKKENADREKPKEHEGRRSRDRDVSGGRYGEAERNGKERKPMARGRDLKSSSLSPVRKIKKTEEPPLRLLDDLFRKTKATPCIYWLPLTPEQIAEKEAFRQKRIEEQKERIKQRELDKEKEREKNRNERSDRDRGRVRDNRRNVSNDRRRSRSRDRRRY